MNFKQFWKNRNHYSLHFFCAGMAVMVSAFALNMGGIIVKRNHAKAEAFSDTVLYTESTDMSQSGTKVNVENVFVSDDDRQCFIMMKFDDMTNVSTNAENYWMTIGNLTDKWRADNAPTEGIKGRLYMFGATGYCAVYLYTTDRPFDDGLKQLNIFSKNIAVRGEQVDADGNIIESTPDMFTIYINPSGNDGKSASFIKNHKIGDDFDMSVIYERLIYYPEETAIKTDLNNITQDMQTTYNKIIEYRDRLKNYDLALPPVPELITGDKFENSFTYEPVYKTDEQGNIITDEITGESVVQTDENGDVIYKLDSNGQPVVKDAYLDFKPASIVPAGISFDYHTLSLKDTGYFEHLEDRGDMTIPEYLKKLSAVSDSESTSVSYSWTYTDGTPVPENGTDSLTQVMKSDIEAYTALLNEYINYKSEYQAKMLPALLSVEHNLHVMSTVYTDTMYEKEVEVPVRDADGKAVLKEDGTPVTEIKNMYVDDDVCVPYGLDTQ